MKKTIFFSILALSLGLGSVFNVAYAQMDIPDACNVEIAIERADECTVATTDADASNMCDPSADSTGPTCGFCCMLNTIYKVTDWLFYILILLVTIMIIYGGFMYITASGDPAKAEKGKAVLTYAIIGLAIALLAKVIPSLIRFVIGV